MLKPLLVILSLFPVLIFADLNLDISICAKDKDNFSRLACFDKVADSLKNAEDVLRIQATSKAIAEASFNDIEKLLSESNQLKKVKFSEALELLAYAKMEFPIRDIPLFWISSELLKSTNEKTVDEIIELATDSEIVKLSIKNKIIFENKKNPKMSDEEALNEIINGESWNSYYDTKSKIKNNKNIVKKLEAAYDFLKANSTEFKNIINGQTIGYVIEQAENLKKELNDYLEKVKIYNLKAKYGDFSEGKFPAIDFKLKNEGERALSLVEITVYFKDKEDNIVYEEKYNPILSTSFENQSLKPNYIWSQEKGKTYLSKSVPNEWKTGAVEAKVTKVEF